MAARALGELEFRGVEELRRKLDPQIFGYANKIVLNRALLKTRSGARERVPGKLFDNSIQKKTIPGTESGIVYSNAQTAESIHGGRKPGETVSIRKLRSYIERYGLAGSVSLKTRRANRRKLTPERDRAILSLAYQMRRRIKAKGTAAIPFLTEPLEQMRASSEDLARYWREAIPVALKKFGLVAR